MKHYLITGRVAGDDEDTIFTCQAESRKEAVSEFLEWLKSVNNFDDFAWKRLIENGEVFVNGIYKSDTPISEATISSED